MKIAVIGMGCLFPRAQGLRDFWKNVRTGVDAIAEVPASHWNPDDYFDGDPSKPDKTYCRRGGFLSAYPFDPMEFGIPPSTIEATDTSQLLGLVVAKQALADAGYTQAHASWNRDKTSVILGVTGTLELVIPLGARLGHPHWKKALREAGIADDKVEQISARIADAYVPWQEASFPGLLGNVVAGRIANRLDLGGTNCVVDAACASSLSALHLATLELESKRAEMVVTGGVDTFNDIFMYMCFSKTPALSPTGDAKPFDESADGTILGEGIGMVVLKRLEDAERDGDRVYCVIRGIGSSSDGKSKSIYAPRSEGQSKALRNAYAAAEVSPRTIELVEAHGTGTKVGDVAEVDALKAVYREARADGTWCALGSIKSQIGHTKAAAGAAGLIKAALALHHKVLPPTLKVKKPNPKLGLDDHPFYVSSETRPWLGTDEHPRRAGVSSFGFGGSNFHVVLEEHVAAKKEPSWDGAVEVLAVSGKDEASLLAALAVAESDPSRGRRDFSAAHARRLVVVAEDAEKLRVALGRARETLAKEKGSFELPEGVFHGAGVAPGKLAFLFPGQGSQYVGMGRELACVFPEAQAAVRESGAGARIFPRPVFTDEARKEQEAALRKTDVAQPALGGVSVGALRVLERFGVKADAVAGHSFGELVALHAAGRLDEGALHELARLRGKLMAECGSGGMLAVLATQEKVTKLLSEEKLDLALANRNAPSQVVLSGPSEEIARAAKACQARGIDARELPVAAAFHSKLVAGAAEPFARELARFAFAAGSIPVYANTTATVYGSDVASVLGKQLVSPVDFQGIVERLHEDGVRTFVEVGPRAVLAGLVNATLGERARAIALDASSGKRGLLDLARALGALAALGYPVALDRWDPRLVVAEEKPRMTVPLTGANHRSTPRSAEPVLSGVEGPPAPVSVAAPAPASTPAPVAPRPAPVARQEMPVRPEKKAEAPRPVAAPPSGLSVPSSGLLSQALAAAQEGIRAVQALQEQTANVHKKFLEQQETAHATYRALLESQQRIVAHALAGGNALAIAFPAPAPVAAAAPVAAPAVPPPAPPRGAGGGQEGGLPAPIAAPSPSRPSTSPRPSTSTNGSADLASIIIAVVAEKTGYPSDMVQLDMDLESDLGIDSIKRVEILSGVQERAPEAPTVEPEHLGRLRTLRQIVDFIQSKASASTSATSTPATTSASRRNTSTSTSASTDLAAIIVAVVSEKTGYPVDMVQLDMDLESDLGIDSIKRVEILSGVQERAPDAPTVEPEHLGRLRTLRQIVDFINSKRGTNGVAHAPPAKAVKASNGTQAHAPRPAETRPIERSLLVTRDLDPAADAPLALAPGHEVWITDDGNVASALAAKLQASGLAARVVPIGGALGRTAPVAGLVILAPPRTAWNADSEAYLRAAFALTKALAADLRAAGRKGGALLATVSRLDGAFGVDGGGLEGAGFDPVMGGLAGLAKTVAQEWPEVRARALDVAIDCTDANAVAAAIARELAASGPIEVGLTAEKRRGLELANAPLAAAGEALALAGSLPIAAGDVVVITGGARGVTAEVAVALARVAKPTLVLLGRSSAPTPEPAWLAELDSEREIKLILAADLARNDQTATPRAVGERYRRVMAEREIRKNLERIAAQGQVTYRSVDIRDAAATARVLDEVRRTLGPIKALIHGAGVLEDKRIEEKTPEQFDSVLDTKVLGLRALLDATREDPLRALVLFSSVSGRFGRRGQVDYAMANEVLSKVAQLESRRRKGCRVVALGWGPWEGGMVTPGLAREFQKEGVGLIPLEGGAKACLAELAASGPAEVVLSVDRGGAPLPQAPSAPPPLRAVTRKLGFAFERDLALEKHAVLRSHVLGGRPVVPLALSMEWLAHAALHGSPGLQFHGFTDLRVLRALAIGESLARVKVLAGAAERKGDGFEVLVELRSESSEGEVVHARANALLAERMPQAPRFEARADVASRPYPRSIDEAYESVLFHGDALRGIDEVLGLSAQGIVAHLRAAPAPEKWVSEPWRTAWVADPLVLDACFQLAILWCREERGALSLPAHVESYRQFRAFPRAGVRATLLHRKNGAHSAVSDIVLTDEQGLVVARFDGYECVVDASLEAAFGAAR